MNTLSTRLCEGHSGKLTSPDLRLRTSSVLWGPLHLSIATHREGAELGYRAGEDAYLHYGQEAGTLTEEALSTYMTLYLAAPGYRPRAMTITIVAEWKAMFLLGWTGHMLESSLLLHVDASGSPNGVTQATREASSSTRLARSREREER